MQMEKLIDKKSPQLQEKFNNKELLKLEKLARKYNENNIPLYLSYPTSSYWKKIVTKDKFKKAFNDNVSTFLYFHFPYCKKACNYCMCYKYVTNDQKDNDLYLNYLEKEFTQKINLFECDELKFIKYIHWGGGTPTLLTCYQIERIFNKIQKKVSMLNDTSNRISIEAYPDDKVITHEKLKLLRSLGFNEISFGVQDFDKRVQKTINRDHSEKVVKKLVSMAQDVGFSVNIDLCYGLPFQGLNELEQTIKVVVEMGIDRIALFTYVHYPLIFPMQKIMPTLSIPNSFIRVLMTDIAGRYLKDMGYLKVGYDHFVKKDYWLGNKLKKEKIIRDFMGYSMEDRKQFIGFGNSAISFFGNTYFHNKISLTDYYNDLDNNRLPIIEKMGHEMSMDDIIRNEIIQQNIMCDFEINKKNIETKFKINFDKTFKKELARLTSFQQDGLVDVIDINRIRINKYGEKFIRHIAHAFDSYY